MSGICIRICLLYCKANISLGLRPYITILKIGHLGHNDFGTFSVQFLEIVLGIIKEKSGVCSEDVCLLSCGKNCREEKT